MFESGYWLNKKNNELYYAEGTVINCTNKDNDSLMVMYYKIKENGDLYMENTFVREIKEFEVKFEKVNLQDYIEGRR
jgi:hypothetical protein